MPISSASFQVSSFGIVSSHLDVLLVFLGNVVPIPCRNFNYNFSRLLDGYLTAKARIQLQIGGHVKAIRFIVVHLREIFRSFFHPDVASGASTIAAASMIQRDTVIQRDIEKRLLFSMIFVRQFAVLELDG